MAKNQASEERLNYLRRPNVGSLHVWSYDSICPISDLTDLSQDSQLLVAMFYHSWESG